MSRKGLGWAAAAGIGLLIAACGGRSVGIQPTGAGTTEGGTDGSCDLTQRGATCFGPEVTTPIPEDAGAPLLAADLDADGVAELVTSHGWIGRRQEPGHYAFAPGYPIGDPSQTGPEAVADLDGDGRADLVGLVAGESLGEAPRLWIAWGGSHGTSAVDEVDLSSVLTGWPCGSTVAVADLDEDERWEVLMLDPPGFEVVVLSVESGAYEVRLRYDLRRNEQWEERLPPSCDRDLFLRAGDLDADEHGDLAVLSGAGAIVVAFGDGTGGLSAPVLWEEPTTEVSLAPFPFAPLSLRHWGRAGVLYTHRPTACPLLSECLGSIRRITADPNGAPVSNDDARPMELEEPSTPQTGRLVDTVVVAATDLAAPEEILIGCVGPEGLEDCARIVIDPVVFEDWPAGGIARDPSVLVVSDPDAPGLVLFRGGPPRLGWIPFRP